MAVAAVVLAFLALFGVLGLLGGVWWKLNEHAKRLRALEAERRAIEGDQ